MELSTWYYTLSTISQTLAAVLALATVFVVLRLENLTRNIGDYKERALKMLNIKEERLTGVKKTWGSASDILIDLEEFQRNYLGKYRKNNVIAGDIMTLSAKYDDFSKANETEFVTDTYKNLNNFVSQRDGLIKLVKWPGIITSLAIALSITLLGLSEKIINPTALLLVVIFSLWGLFSVVRAAWKILDAIKRIE